MGSYKAYLEQGLDLCPKIYLQEDPDPQTQHAHYLDPQDVVSQDIEFAYECTASSSKPTHDSQDIESAPDYIASSSIPTRSSKDTEFAPDYIASSSIPTRSSQDTRFALTTSSSNRTNGSRDIQFTPDISSASLSNPTRPSQDTQLDRSTPTHNSQGDFTASPNNRTPSHPRSNPLSCHSSHLPELQTSHTDRPKSKDREPSPPRAAPQLHDPCPPCAKRLWSKVIRAPPPLEPPSPRPPGLWTKVLCSPTTPPPASDPSEPEASRPHGSLSRRRRSSVPLLDLPPTELQPKMTAKERRQSSPIPASAFIELDPPRAMSLRSYYRNPPSHHQPNLGHKTTTAPVPQRSTRSSPQKDQTPIHVSPSPSSPYSSPYSLNPRCEDTTDYLLPLQYHLNYTFTHSSLLTQALTTPTPGHSGNARLSYLGRRAMELVLWESCYALRLSERAAREAVARALGVEALVGAGMRCGLGWFMGTRGNLAEEVRRGVLAVVGGVYLDGGVGEVRRVMGGLGVGVGEG